MKRDAFQSQEYFEKMIANQALQIKSLQNELEESREAKALMEDHPDRGASVQHAIHAGARELPP
jgi:hypothetical protein